MGVAEGQVDRCDHSDQQKRLAFNGIPLSKDFKLPREHSRNVSNLAVRKLISRKNLVDDKVTASVKAIELAVMVGEAQVNSRKGKEESDVQDILECCARSIESICTLFEQQQTRKARLLAMYRKLLFDVYEMEKFAAQLMYETEGSIQVSRLEKSSSLFHRCKHVATESRKKLSNSIKACETFRILEVFRIANRHTRSEFRDFVREHPTAEIKGLYVEIERRYFETLVMSGFKQVKNLEDRQAFTRSILSNWKHKVELPENLRRNEVDLEEAFFMNQCLALPARFSASCSSYIESKVTSTNEAQGLYYFCLCRVVIPDYKRPNDCLIGNEARTPCIGKSNDVMISDPRAVLPEYIMIAAI